MSNLVSNNTRDEILSTIETVKNMQQPTVTRTRRRVRTGGSGETSLVYLEITASTDANTYTATIYDNPVDRNEIEAGVTVKAIQHTTGVIPDSTSGKGFFANLHTDGNYYVQPGVFL